MSKVPYSPAKYVTVVPKAQSFPYAIMRILASVNFSLLFLATTTAAAAVATAIHYCYCYNCYC